MELRFQLTMPDEHLAMDFVNFDWLTVKRAGKATILIGRIKLKAFDYRG